MIALAATTAALEEVRHRVAQLLEEQEYLDGQFAAGTPGVSSSEAVFRLAIRRAEIAGQLQAWRDATTMLETIRTAAYREERP